MNDEIAEIQVERKSAPQVRRGGRARRLLLRIHRTIGLLAGAVFVLVGLSGGILAFREDIDELLNASIMRVDVPERPLYRPVDEIVSAALAALPPEGRLERLTMPRHSRAAAVATYMVETDDLDSYVHELFVDPYTARVKGSRLFLHGDDPLSQPFIQILMTFHWTLLLGVNNAYIVGAVGVLMFLSLCVGMYLWWPRNGDWRLGLKVKWGASPERVVFDLHRSVGAYFGAMLAIMLFTGVAMIFKPTTRAMANLFSPVRADPDFGKSAPQPGQSPLSAGAAATIANDVFPDGRLRWILFPSAPTGVYVVGKQADDEPNRTKTYRNVGVDQYSGRVLHVQDRNRFTAGETFLEWLFPLHTGEAFGEASRPLFLLIGLTPLMLYATGLLRWLQKRRARKRPAST
jgi:uncharacterized iron-regulated membrane protein